MVRGIHFEGHYSSLLYSNLFYGHNKIHFYFYCFDFLDMLHYDFIHNNYQYRFIFRKYYGSVVLCVKINELKYFEEDKY